MHDIPKQIPLANNHISVDCVVIGFDGEQLKVLLINRIGEENGKVYRDMKLPGSLIYMDEDLDEAAQRVLFELTGIRNVNLMQFKAFGSKNRTSNPKDVHWLERASIIDGHLGWFHVFAIMNSAAINIHVHVSFCFFLCL